MSDVSVVDALLRVSREGLLLVLFVAGPPLLAALAVGLLVGVLQTATQVHDQTLSFVPKLAAVVLVLVALGPALGAQFLRFTEAIFTMIAAVR
jgi:flagellar biosynthesis protein FliQ